MESYKEFVKVTKDEFQLARRRTVLRIDLDVLTNNINILKNQVSNNIEIIAVVKGNAYGHGAVELSKHLRDIGIKHFAVASPWEGIQLREAGIQEFIQILGNACEEEIPDLIDYDLVPTTGSLEFLQQWSLHARNNCTEYTLTQYENEKCVRPVVIKVDTGMSRNGCQVEELDDLVHFCDEHEVKVHSIMTHFSAAWDNPQFTTQQLDAFLRVASKFRPRGIKLHVANSAAILQGYGIDLDFVRPGIAMYGLPPDTTAYALDMYRELGLRPILSWLAKPNLVKTLKADRTVGYDNTHKCEDGDVVGTVSAGYADGYNRLLSNNATVTTETGLTCPVIGRVSMDAITVQLPHEECKDMRLYLIKDDFTSPNSVVQLAKQLNTITYEVPTSLAARLARVYITDNRMYLKR